MRELTNGIKAPAGCKGAILLEGEGIYCSGVSFLLQHALARGQVPQAPGLVEAGRAQVQAQGVEGDAPQPLLMPPQVMQQLACAAPDPGAPVRRACRYCWLLWAALGLPVRMPVQACSTRALDWIMYNLI